MRLIGTTENYTTPLSVECKELNILFCEDPGIFLFWNCKICDKSVFNKEKY